MPDRVSIPFVGPESRSRSIAVDNQATVNFMQAIKGQGAKAPIILETPPGLVFRSVLGDGPIRTSQMEESNIRGSGTDLYGVYGSKLMAQTTAGDFEIGTLDVANLANRVQMARGRTHIMMVDGKKGYTYDGTTFAEITHPDFPGVSDSGKPTHAAYLDGFFIVNDATTDNFFISASEDPTSWNALDFEAASVTPDAALALATTESLLWVIGDESAQAFYNAESVDFPFRISLSATQDKGILAPYSIAESDDGLFYLATTPEGGRFVYQIQGQSGRVITEDEQEAALTTVIDPTTAYGFIYKQAGKSFYVLQLGATLTPDPRDSVTLIYNIKVGRWERRELQDGTAWRAGGHGILGNRNVVGSRLQAQSMFLDLRDFTDLGQELVRTRRTQIYHINNKLMDWWQIVIDVETGIGDANTPNPVLRLRYSNDAGRTWSAYLTQSMGRVGQTMHRVVYNNLGQGRNRVWELQISDPINATVIAAYAVVQVLND